MKIKSRFDNRCQRCDAPLFAGDMIEYDPDPEAPVRVACPFPCSHDDEVVFDRPSLDDVYGPVDSFTPQHDHRLPDTLSPYAASGPHGLLVPDPYDD